MLSQFNDLCRVAKTYTRLGQSIATSMELGFSKSRFLGIGVEYADFREYQEGDDIRYIDWRLTARSLDPVTESYKLYTKVFHVEYMKDIVFATDLTNSMLIKDKIASTFYTASLTLELSHRLGDKVHLITMGKNVETYEKLRGREAITILENTICKRKTVGGKTNLNNLLKTLKTLTKKNIAIVIITDYAHTIEEFKTLTEFAKTTETPLTIYITVYRWEIEKPIDKAITTLLDSETGYTLTENIEDIYKTIKNHINYIKTILTINKTKYLELKGIQDTKTKTTKIAELYLKTRQKQLHK